MRYLLHLALISIALTGCWEGTVHPGPTGKPETDSLTKVANADSSQQDDHLPGAVKADGGMNRDILEDAPKQVRTHMPDGYVITDTCLGDLNKDGFTDLLMVLCIKDEYRVSNTADSTIKRKLLLLTGNAQGSYDIAASTDNAVYCISCGGMMGDPFQGLVIKNGYFSIEHYGGSRERWERTTTFKYSPADSTWLLYKDGHATFDAVPEESTGKDKKITKIYTVKDFGRVTLDSFDIYKN